MRAKIEVQLVQLSSFNCKLSSLDSGLNNVESTELLFWKSILGNYNWSGK
jgi:hypothetical protein